jgi:hypothetical protein
MRLERIVGEKIPLGIMLDIAADPDHQEAMKRFLGVIYENCIPLLVAALIRKIIFPTCRCHILSTNMVFLPERTLFSQLPQYLKLMEGVDYSMYSVVYDEINEITEDEGDFTELLDNEGEILQDNTIVVPEDCVTDVDTQFFTLSDIPQGIELIDQAEFVTYMDTHLRMCEDYKQGIFVDGDLIIDGISHPLDSIAALAYLVVTLMDLMKARGVLSDEQISDFYSRHRIQIIRKGVGGLMKNEWIPFSQFGADYVVDVLGKKFTERSIPVLSGFTTVNVRAKNFLAAYITQKKDIVVNQSSVEIPLSSLIGIRSRRVSATEARLFVQAEKVSLADVLLIVYSDKVFLIPLDKKNRNNNSFWTLQKYGPRKFSILAVKMKETIPSMKLRYKYRKIEKKYLVLVYEYQEGVDYGSSYVPCLNAYF